MIVSFADDATYQLFTNGTVPEEGCGWAKVAERAERKLDLLDEAEAKTDLFHPPSNRFESLEGAEDRYSIRINDQWRIAFTWNDGEKEAVEITDYHQE